VPPPAAPACQSSCVAVELLGMQAAVHAVWIRPLSVVIMLPIHGTSSPQLPHGELLLLTALHVQLASSVVCYVRGADLRA
jgi:hypothetical protein